MRSHLTLTLLGLFCCLLFTSARADEVLTLEVAAQNGDLATVRRLVEQGTDPRSQDINGSTAVHSAASGGHLEVLEYLLQAGGLPDHADLLGKRPLYEAASSGSVECCRLLMRHGADLNSPTAGRWTPLDASIYWGGDETTALLLLAGARFGACPKGESLGVAARRGYPRTLKILLKSGIDPNHPDEAGRTALHHAASQSQLEILNLLLNSGANPEAKDSSGATPLLTACSVGNLETVKRLQATAKTPECLSRAAARSDQSTANKILEYLLTTIQPDTNPVKAAIRSGNLQAVQLLLQAGAPVSADETLLAAAVCQPEILAKLLNIGIPAPSIQEVKKQWQERHQALTEIVESNSHNRAITQAYREARAELERMAQNEPLVARLLQP